MTREQISHRREGSVGFVPRRLVSHSKVSANAEARSTQPEVEELPFAVIFLFSESP